MANENHGIDEMNDVFCKALGHVRRIQHAISAMLSDAGVERRVKAITTICMELPSIDDIRIHLLDMEAGQLGVPVDDNAALTNAIISSGLQAIEEPGADPLRPVVYTGRACYIERGAKDAIVEPAFWDVNNRMHAIYFVPLVFQARVIGVLRAARHHSGGIHQEIRIVLELLAPQFALAIENAWLHQQVKTPAAGGPHTQAPVVPNKQALSSQDMAAWMAHEIKTPLTTISTFIQLFPTKWKDDHFRTLYYPIARDETQRLSRLVNDMLDRGKNQSKRLKPVDIQALVHDLVARAVPSAESRHLRFQTHFALASSIIRIDKGRIEEAISNLVDNAMEATPDGGKIRIRLEDVVMPGGRPAIQLEIQDSGSGIDKAIITEIFDPYVSTKANSSLPGGTGLGLYIARHNVQAHGGTIEVESPAPTGALFRVILPVERRRR